MHCCIAIPFPPLAPCPEPFPLLRLTQIYFQNLNMQTAVLKSKLLRIGFLYISKGAALEHLDGVNLLISFKKRKKV
jgi:hypothetical protein